MPSMPGTVTKTKTFTAMDAFWNADPAGKMSDYDKKDFDTLLNEAVSDPKMRDHVRNHWIDKNGYFGAAEAEDVLRRGLYWAMRVAVYEDAGGQNEKTRAKVLPIYCAWVCSGGKPHPKKKQQSLFEVITLESDWQVTLLFLTPSAAGAGWGRKGDPLQRVWATRRIEFEKYNGEEQLEEWPADTATTRTVRPYDYEEL